MRNVKAGHDHPIVCLNAGHSGKVNQSPVVKAYYEAEMNWKLHNFLADELSKYGIEVWKTRKDQAVGMNLIERGKAADGADLWLSIHSNDCDTESVDYPLAIYMVADKRTQIDEQSKELGGLLAQTIYEVMQTKQKPKTWSREAGRDIDGDGVRNDEWYGELRGAHNVDVPGLILEHSFHSNKRSAEWLLKDENLQQLAATEANTIAAWFDVDKLPEEPESPSAPQEPEKVEGKRTFFRVVVSSSLDRKYAEEDLKKAKAAGFEDAFIAAVEV